LPETFRLAVNGELWERVDDLAVAGPEVPPPAVAGSTAPASGSSAALSAGVTPPRRGNVRAGLQLTKVYTLDPESGEVRFGPPGTRPPLGAVIVASYAYGGGREGVVGIGAIEKAPALPAGLKVGNPAVTWGGDEPESVADAEHRIPRFVRHRDRLVAADDFHDLAWDTPGVDLGRVEVLPLVHPGMPGVPADGVVTLLLIPLFDAEHPDNPEPDRLFLETVCRHLEPRRLVTTELHLVGPEYRDLWVSVGVEVVPGTEQGPVLDRVEVEVRRFLSPLAGGFSGRGWPLEKAVEAGELTAAATRAGGVARVTGLLLANAEGGQVTTLPITGFRLPRVAGIAVAAGDPVPIADLMGTQAPVPGAPRRLPVPVVPEEC
jgi:predicted phage baseplate assembly protein